ncbi:SixA phosphatase family protein [Thermomonospora curvata]|uniref:Putative phosphohistidine phosphatase, SixA n=1 Tax=Thermomonospora curvata (strain ATCC 19995 / DSM 43183 / JCM 3096 / KCTC 9072 / NBRC 15933 / NCIMB 10081 / Henssen B9) TaxID=471852 RepID=D1A7D5_THECD|nr:histidine phosphatase family protein [Thermomonospora curvata]ACZ00341.1 putative phosphohistidine phosphatase, SixA [Thermomonospora curvata DSM 43183]
MPTLIVLRHAKAVDGAGMADIDRPLASRGHRDAAATGQWLRENDLVPDLVLCSTAVRTRETLEDLALPSPVEFEPGLYDNHVDIAFSLIREVDDDVDRLLVIGHNPSMHQLVYDLTGGAPESFPTCALAVIELSGPWPDTWPGGGTLLTHRTPKD